MKSGNGRQPHLYPLPSVLTLHKSWTIFFYSPTCETYSPSCISRMPGCEGLDGEAFTGVTNGWQLPFSTRTYILYLSPPKTFTRSQTLRFWLISIRSRREGLGWWSLHKVSHCSQPGRVWLGGCEHLKIQTFTRFYYENQRETGGLWRGERFFRV